MGRDELDDIKTLSTEKRYPEVIALARSLISKRPNNIAAHRALAHAYSAVRDFEAAVACHKKILRLEPHALDVSVALGACYNNLGRFEDALDIFKQCVSGDPENALIHACLGATYVSLDRSAQALPHLEAAVTRRPDVITYWKNLASVQSSLGRYADAAKTVRSAYRRWPGDDGILRNYLSISESLTADDVDESIIRASFAKAKSRFFGLHPGLDITLSNVAQFRDRYGPAHPQSIVIQPPQQVMAKYGHPEVIDEYRADGTWIANISGGMVLAGWDFAITPQKEVLEGSGYLTIGERFPWLPHRFLGGSSKVVHPWSARPEIVDQSVLFLSNPYKFQIGHWFVDFLPRLRASGVPQIQPYKIAILKDLPNRHRDFLKAFGVTHDDLFEMDFCKVYSFSSLLVIGQCHRESPSPERVNYLHRHLAAPELKPRGIGLFLERGGAGRGRRVANSAEFSGALDELGIARVQLSTLTIDEQKQIFSENRVVISAPGSDLAAVLCMPRGSNLIILVHDHNHESIEKSLKSFERHASISGIAVSRFVCETSREGEVDAGQKWRENYYRDLIVDIDKFKRHVLTALEDASGQS